MINPSSDYRAASGYQQQAAYGAGVQRSSTGAIGQQGGAGSAAGTASGGAATGGVQQPFYNNQDQYQYQQLLNGQQQQQAQVQQQQAQASQPQAQSYPSYFMQYNQGQPQGNQQGQPQAVQGQGVQSQVGQSGQSASGGFPASSAVGGLSGANSAADQGYAYQKYASAYVPTYSSMYQQPQQPQGQGQTQQTQAHQSQVQAAPSYGNRTAAGAGASYGSNPAAAASSTDAAAGVSSNGTPVPNDTLSASNTSSVGQYQPPGIRPRVTTTMWEDEKTLCYQVDANNVSVVRRADNNMINGTKLLNVAQMTRGRRDGILKSEKVRHVVKIGSMHLKGVWIPFERALAMAQREGIVDLLYPLFVRDIKRVIQTGVTPNLASVASSAQPLNPAQAQVQPPPGGSSGQQLQPASSGAVGSGSAASAASTSGVPNSQMNLGGYYPYGAQPSYGQPINGAQQQSPLVSAVATAGSSNSENAQHYSGSSSAQQLQPAQQLQQQQAQQQQAQQQVPQSQGGALQQQIYGYQQPTYPNQYYPYNPNGGYYSQYNSQPMYQAAYGYVGGQPVLQQQQPQLAPHHSQSQDSRGAHHPGAGHDSSASVNGTGDSNDTNTSVTSAGSELKKDKD